MLIFTDLSVVSLQKASAITYTLLLSVVVVAGGAIIGFDVYVSDDPSAKLAIQEAVAQKPHPPEKVGILPLASELPVWTPGQPTFNPPHQPADMTNANVVFNVIIPYLGGWIHEEVTPYFADPSVAFRYVTLILNAGYDASAPYHATAVGVYSNIENRPASEYANDENINIATMHAVYQLALKFDPDKKSHWESMMRSIDLDPTDMRGLELDCSVPDQSLSDPVIIGNFAGKCVLEGRQNSGFSPIGFETSGTYPIIPVTTDYTPVNSHTNLVDPSKWQPLVNYRDNVQQFVTPQWANTEPLTEGFNPRSVRADTPTKSDYENNMEGYREQASEVLHAVANLDDYQKMVAEYFDNKAREVIFFPAVEVNPSTFRTADFYRLDFMLHIAQFDAGIVTWQEKARYDAVRPITAIQHLYANEQVPTFDDKDPSTPQMISGSQWMPYVDTGDHPEYPSATACFCAAQAEAWKLHYGGSDNIGTFDFPNPASPTGFVEVPGFTGSFAPGSSLYEPGITPSSTVTLNYERWSDYVAECGESRIWSGLHFRPAVEASIEICADVGAQAFNYFETLMSGDATSPRAPAMPLSDDPGPLRVCR